MKKCKQNFMQKLLYKQGEFANNSVLSQITLADSQAVTLWLFYCLNCANNLANPSYTGKSRLPFMVWLILQNKPVGEYAKRFLMLPRVRPHRPIVRVFTQNKTLGVFA